MTNQEKKVYLKKYQEAERESSRLEEEIARWYSKAEKTTSVISQVPGGGGCDRLQGAVEEIDGLAIRLGEQRIKSVQTRQDVDRAIQSVTGERLQRLLRYRYIDGMTWEAIAEKMECSERWIYKLHRWALSAISSL